LTYFFKTESGDYINASEVHHFCVKKVQTNLWEIRAYLKTFVGTSTKERDYVSIRDTKTEMEAQAELQCFVSSINKGA
jgi:hypothetical protein